MFSLDAFVSKLWVSGLCSFLLVCFIGVGCVFANDIYYVSSTLWTEFYDVQVVGDYAYGVFANGLIIVDVSNPADPSFVSQLYFTGGGDGKGLFVQDNYVYLADGDSGLMIIDVNDPANPNSVGSYDDPGQAWDVFVKDSLAYVADRSSGLLIINVSDPAHPTLLGSWNTPGEATGVYVQGNYAYVADYTSGLQIIDVSDPANPDSVGSYDTTSTAYGVFVVDSLVYLADYDNGLLIFQLRSLPLDLRTSTRGTSSSARTAWSTALHWMCTRRRVYSAASTTCLWLSSSLAFLPS